MTITVERDTGTGVAVVTLDRPVRHNALTLTMARRLAEVWRGFRYEDDIRAIVITGAGQRAFCTGVDRTLASELPQPTSPFTIDDPLLAIGPKSNDLWKPVVAAVEGMACGGAFYLLAEAEFLIAGEGAEFFDPHTTYGMVSAFETIHMAQRMPYGEVARMALMGTAERLSAERAHAIGLVSELTVRGGALAAAREAAAVVAAYPTEAVQGTVRALWSAREAARAQALAHAPHLIALGNLPPERQAELFARRARGARAEAEKGPGAEKGPAPGFRVR
ncbi:enoyl-CoA hydratase/isomerase family protein [Streptomyces sp. NPDC048717]|uniref:enoyl-CoA hydratase/isomerase family protein n=1 Tax=Streptomyces sp. NPDC048717 TaxID=3154928 RepID=UPI00343CCB0A